MNERVDLSFCGGTVTRKVMPNGETRTRMKLNDGPTTTITEIPRWKWSECVPVQEGHFHRGLTEIYVVLKGWMLYVGPVVPAGYEIQVVERHRMVTFTPGEPHLILLGPDAVIQTTTTGSRMCNLDRLGQDWWPVGKYYSSVRFDENSLGFARERQREAEWNSRHVFDVDQ